MSSKRAPEGNPDDLFAAMERMFREMVEQMGVDIPPNFTFGFTLNQREGESPEVRPFGDRPPAAPGETPARRPRIEVLETPDEVRVIAEVPGARRGDLRLQAQDRTLHLRAPRGDEGEYAEEVRLPAPVDPRSARATCRHGVLEVRIRKRAAPRKAK
ncbi:MAG: Hsp20/alpha crystallin family protein [Euryarchaeota archaeon]|nr:Hsp20/alpha crystallin family protein [Euryarchaeota archaeon]